MLIISDSIRQKELKKVEKYFSHEDIKAMARKVSQGLGTTLRGAAGGRIVKIKSTFRGVAGRSVFFVITKTNDIFPVLIRLKKDFLGANLTFQNKAFREYFYRNYRMMEDDLKNDRFEIFEI